MMRALAAVLMLACALPLAAHPVRFDCAGQISTEDLFDGGGRGTSEQRWHLVASVEGGYVRRAPELASGCLEATVEVCGCELTSAAVRCRSLGISRDGVEVAMDFSIDRHSGRMTVAGRRFDPRSGTVIETNGLLACKESESMQ